MAARLVTLSPRPWEIRKKYAAKGGLNPGLRDETQTPYHYGATRVVDKFGIIVFIIYKSACSCTRASRITPCGDICLLPLEQMCTSSLFF
jgi:hypothetical protein